MSEIRKVKSQDNFYIRANDSSIDKKEFIIESRHDSSEETETKEQLNKKIKHSVKPFIIKRNEQLTRAPAIYKITNPNKILSQKQNRILLQKTKQLNKEFAQRQNGSHLPSLSK